MKWGKGKIGGTLIVILLIPVFLSFFVYNSEILPCIPGKDETWMGFWASYSGTIATLVVAFLTWKNSKSIVKLQKQYYELDTNANLRLNKIVIIPIIRERGVINQYQIKIVFNNMAKCLIQKMTIANEKVTIMVGEMKEEMTALDYKCFLRENRSVLQFRIEIPEKDIEMRKAFVDFYYYYSQFSPKMAKMKMEMAIQIFYEDKEKETPIDKRFEVILSPTPAYEKRKENFIDEDKYSTVAYKVLTENYTFVSKS